MSQSQSQRNTSLLMEQYLRNQQQINNIQDNASECGSSVYGGRKLEQALIDVPDNTSLEEFKHHVKMWMELDNQVKKMNMLVREKKTVQKALTEKILSFMSRYNIEDLNTKEGKLRYKVSYSKPQVKKVDMKDKILNYFEHDKELGSKVVEAVFMEEDKAKVEKVSLRRLKGVRVMNV